MRLFAKKREEGEDTPHPKDTSPHPKDASPHPKDASSHLSATQTPSPEGEGFEARPTGELPTESGERVVGRTVEDACPYEQNSNETVGDAETSLSLPSANPPPLKGEAIARDAVEGIDAPRSLEEMVLAEFGELRDIAPTLTIGELLGSEDMPSIGARLRRGYSLRDAYLLSKMKQDGRGGCSHLQKTSPTHRATTALPADVLAAYSIFMPKASRAEIQKNYLDYLSKTGKA